MTRNRIHVAATVPETGAYVAAANLIVTWDSSASDAEEAIKEAAREAVHRVREAHSPLGPPPGPPNPPRTPHDRPYA